MKSITRFSSLKDSRIDKFIKSRLYGVTDLKEWSEREAFRIEEACRGAVEVLQLRSKVLDKHALIDAGWSMREMTMRWGVLLVVNDYPDIAAAIGADGVHLGQKDLPVSEARSYFEVCDVLIGKSTHSLEQAVAAEDEGADYIGMGPIFSTPTKPSYGGMGLEWIREVKQRVAIPGVAIGGMNGETIPLAIRAGADRVAVVRAIFSEEDVFEATRRLKKIIELNFKSRSLN